MLAGLAFGGMSEITILDGGMGKELRRIGAPFRQPEWSALALLESPDHVAEAHRNFINAGAQVIITNTYSVVPYHLGAERFDERGRELAELAARTARAEAAAVPHPVQVAGSLPPLFGSYEPEAFQPDAAPALWRTLIEAQADHVDFWVGETISSTEELATLMATLAETAETSRGSGPAPVVWASFTLGDHLVDGKAELRSGQSMTTMWEALVNLPAVADQQLDLQAVLFNCAQPEVITEALRELVSVDGVASSGIRLGAYANAFTVAALGDPDYASNTVINERRTDLTTDRYAELVGEWIDAGATIVGGCCDIYADDIAELVQRFGS